MQYITGVYALNLPCSLEATGDWHSSALNWERPETADTEKSVFGAYGIEDCSFVPQHPVCKSGPTISGHFWISSRMVGSVRRVELKTTLSARTNTRRRFLRKCCF